MANGRPGETADPRVPPSSEKLPGIAHSPVFPAGYLSGSEGVQSAEEEFNLRSAIMDHLQENPEISEDILWKRLKKRCKLHSPAINKERLLSELTEVRLEMLSEQTVSEDDSTTSEGDGLSDGDEAWATEIVCEGCGIGRPFPVHYLGNFACPNPECTAPKDHGYCPRKECSKMGIKLCRPSTTGARRADLRSVCLYCRKSLEDWARAHGKEITAEPKARESRPEIDGGLLEAFVQTLQQTGNQMETLTEMLRTLPQKGTQIDQDVGSSAALNACPQTDIKTGQNMEDSAGLCRESPLTARQHTPSRTPGIPGGSEVIHPLHVGTPGPTDRELEEVLAASSSAGKTGNSVLKEDSPECILPINLADSSARGIDVSKLEKRLSRIIPDEWSLWMQVLNFDDDLELEQLIQQQAKRDRATGLWSATQEVLKALAKSLVGATTFTPTMTRGAFTGICSTSSSKGKEPLPLGVGLQRLFRQMFETKIKYRIPQEYDRHLALTFMDRAAQGANVIQNDPAMGTGVPMRKICLCFVTHFPWHGSSHGRARWENFNKLQTAVTLLRGDGIKGDIVLSQLILAVEEAAKGHSRTDEDVVIRIRDILLEGGPDAVIV